MNARHQAPGHTRGPLPRLPRETMLGQLLSEARQRRNVTMDEVGAAVGVTPSCVARWETSRETMPNSRHLWRLCEFLQLDAVLLVRACDPSGEGVRDD